MKLFLHTKICEKGQDLIEYAILLALIVGIGSGVYAAGGLPSSISNIFSGGASIMKEAAGSTAGKNTNHTTPGGTISQTARSFLAALYDGKFNPDSTLYSTATGKKTKSEGEAFRDADMLSGNEDLGHDVENRIKNQDGVKLAEGDEWFLLPDGNGNTYLVYYSAAENGNVKYNDRRLDYLHGKSDGSSVTLTYGIVSSGDTGHSTLALTTGTGYIWRDTSAGKHEGDVYFVPSQLKGWYS